MNKEGYQVYDLTANIKDGKITDVLSVKHLGETDQLPEVEVEQDHSGKKKARLTVNIKTTRDKLLQELQKEAGSIDISEERRQETLHYIREIRDKLANIEIQRPDTEGRYAGQLSLNIFPVEALSTDPDFIKASGLLLFNSIVFPVLDRLIKAHPFYKSGKKSKKKAKDDQAKVNIKISAPFTKQLFRQPATVVQERLKPVEEIVEKWKNYTGAEINAVQPKYGLSLTVRQRNCLLSIIQEFTETKYKGNTEQLYIEDVIPKHKEQPEEVEKNVKALQIGKKPPMKALPQLRLTQAEYLRLCGIPEDARSERQEAIAALKTLQTEQHCFWWKRQARAPYTIKDRSGKTVRTEYRPIRNTDGSPKIEHVYTVETVLKVKEIVDPQTNMLLYYEIAPSIALAQCLQGGDFLMYSYQLEKAIEAKTGKRLKKYEAQLLLWLTMKFEDERRERHILKQHGNEAALQKRGGLTPSEILMDYEQIGAELTMPDSLLKKKRKLAYNQLGRAYEIAKQAGFLKEYERLGTGEDRLIFNTEAYYIPGRQPAEKGDE